MSFWFNEAKRLTVAKQFQTTRLDYLEREKIDTFSPFPTDLKLLVVA